MNASQKPKKALILSYAYYPRFVGGAEVALKEITDRIAPEDIEFHMVTLRFDASLPKEERIGNVLVHRIGLATTNPSIDDLGRFPLYLNKGLFQFLAAWTALKLHARYRYDFLWAMMAHSSGIPAGLVKRFAPKLPYLLTLQEGDPLEHIEGVMRPVMPLFRTAFTRADVIQAISTFLASWAKRMGYAGDPVVIPNGVNSARFREVAGTMEQEALRTALGKKPDAIVIITTSRLVRKNGIDDVIRALPFLPGNISFLIYGIGPEEEALRALADELGVRSRVRFMGEVSGEEIPSVLSGGDIFARPSRSEGMGNSFIEAMAAGLPVIATQVGGLSDFIYDADRNRDKEATAWAVDPDAPEQIADAVKEILAHPEQTKETVARARAMALQHYDWDGVTTRMRGVFDQLSS